jgi:acylphosphatase
VKRAIEWCKRGPPLASVEKVEVRYEQPTGEFRDFRILR